MSPQLAFSFFSLYTYKPDQHVALQMYVLADTTFNSMSVDEVAAQHVNANCIVSSEPPCSQCTVPVRLVVCMSRPKNYLQRLVGMSTALVVGTFFPEFAAILQHQYHHLGMLVLELG